MVAVPAWVWRFGIFVGGLIVGLAVAVVLALLALIGSNSPLAGVVALVVIWVIYSVTWLVGCPSSGQAQRI
jgi:hypothetical protein